MLNINNTSFQADGTIVEGYGRVDESMITGESVPVDKKVGSEVTGGTVNVSGHFSMRAERVGADSALSHIVRLVMTAQLNKAPIQAREALFIKLLRRREMTLLF